MRLVRRRYSRRLWSGRTRRQSVAPWGDETAPIVTLSVTRKEIGRVGRSPYLLVFNGAPVRTEMRTPM